MGARRGGWIVLGLALAVLASVWRLDLIAALGAGRDGLGELLRFVARFATPDLAPAFLATVGQGALETVAISLIGTLLAVIGGAALALPASGRFGWLARSAARFALNALRSVPELVWATLTVLAAGQIGRAHV